MRFELVLEFFASVAFIEGELLVKPAIHPRIDTQAHAEAATDDLANALSCREKGIQAWVE
jgi:hypothetical protein